MLVLAFVAIQFVPYGRDQGEMPLRMYQLMHARARLSAADRERLARGLERTLGRGKTEAARADR